MNRFVLPIGLAAALAISGCEEMTTEQQMVGGALAGAAIGIVGAKALDANDNWTILAALSGAAVGTLVARNRAKDQCAYSNGDGTYTIRTCP